MNTISTSLSGLLAASKQLSVSASNIANASSQGETAEGGVKPYEPQAVELTAQTGGVSATIVPRDNPFAPLFAPDSPLADEQGFISAPNISLEEELVNAKRAEQNYKASATLLSTSNELHETLLDAIDEEA